MVKIESIHSIQANILVSLLFIPEARFSQLNSRGLSSDLFNFHLKKLIADDLIEKTGENKYRLTNGGKEFANRFDTANKKIERQAKIGVLICCKRNVKAGCEYLLQQRLKQPYYGYWGFITGKVRWGESIYETAGRELKEETGMTADFKLSGIKHKSDFDESDNLLEDKFFFVLKATNSRGKLIEEFVGGKNAWINQKDILKIKELFGDVGQTLEIVRGENITFTEIKYKAARY